jgi:hypothetical protein
MEEIKDKSADEMFEELGYEKNEIYYNSDVDTTTYIRDYKYASNIEFKHSGKTVVVFYGEKEKAGNISMNILKIINKKCE